MHGVVAFDRWGELAVVARQAQSLGAEQGEPAGHFQRHGRFVNDAQIEGLRLIEGFGRRSHTRGRNDVAAKEIQRRGSTKIQDSLQN